MNEVLMRQLDHEELQQVTHGALNKLLNLCGSATQGTLGSFVVEMAGKEPPPIQEARNAFDRWAGLVGERYRRMSSEAKNATGGT